MSEPEPEPEQRQQPELEPQIMGVVNRRVRDDGAVEFKVCYHGSGSAPQWVPESAVSGELIGRFAASLRKARAAAKEAQANGREFGASAAEWRELGLTFSARRVLRQLQACGAEPRPRVDAMARHPALPSGGLSAAAIYLAHFLGGLCANIFRLAHTEALEEALEDREEETGEPQEERPEKQIKTRHVLVFLDGLSQEAEQALVWALAQTPTDTTIWQDDVDVVRRAVRQEDVHQRMRPSKPAVKMVVAVLHAFVHMVGSQMRQANFLRSKGESVWATISWDNEQWQDDGAEEVNLRRLPCADINLYLAQRLSTGIINGSHSAERLGTNLDREAFGAAKIWRNLAVRRLGRAQQLMAFARGLLERRADGSELLPCTDIVEEISQRVPRPSAAFARAFGWALRGVINSRSNVVPGHEGSRAYKLLYTPADSSPQELPTSRHSRRMRTQAMERLPRFERWVAASFVTAEQIQNYELRKLKDWLKRKTFSSANDSSASDDDEGGNFLTHWPHLSIAHDEVELEGKQLERELQLARGAVARAKDTRAREREEEKRARAARARETEEEKRKREEDGKRQQEEARRTQRERTRRGWGLGPAGLRDWEAEDRERSAEQLSRLSRRRAARRAVASCDEIVAASVGSRPMAGLADILACARMGVA